jgi:hypothetical protein
MTDRTIDDSVKSLFVMRSPGRKPRAVPDPLTEPTLGTDPATEGSLYVLEFSSGRLKVGFSTNLKARLANHASTAKAYGASITRTWTSPFHKEAKPNERQLLSLCRSIPGVEAEGEYFAGISWDEVVALAESELTMTAVAPGQSEGDRRRAAARDERTRILDSFEDRIEFTRRRVHAQLREAGVQIERVGAEKWLMDPAITRVLAQLHDAEEVDPQEIRDAFRIGGGS